MEEQKKHDQTDELLTEMEIEAALDAAEKAEDNEDAPTIQKTGRAFTVTNIDDDPSDKDATVAKRYTVLVVLIVCVLIWDIVCLGLKASGKLTNVQSMLYTAPTIVLALIVPAIVKKH